MFSRFFSCLSDASESHQHIDLSRQSNLQPYIPKFNPESNVSGQRINFETHDFQRFQQRKEREQEANGQVFNQDERLQKDHEQTYNIEETKITTASPSKNQLHKMQIEEMNPDLVEINSSNIISRNRIENSDFFQQHQQDSQPQTLEEEEDKAEEYDMIGQLAAANEKQLNNYLQQAAYLANPTKKRSAPKKQVNHLVPEKSSTEKGSSSGSSQTHRNQPSSQLMQSSVANHSSTFRQSMDSSQNSKVLFNAANYQSTNVLDYQSITNNDISVQESNKTPKMSFSGNQNKLPKKSALKKDDIKKISDNRQIKKVTLETVQSPLNQFKKAPQQIKASILTKGKITQIKQNLANKQTITKQKQQIQQNDLIIQEEDLSYLQSPSDQLILDYEDGYQMDLGALKSLNKRQASKTEAFTSSLAQYTHRKNKLSANPNNMKSSLFFPQNSTLTQNMSKDSNANNGNGQSQAIKSHKKNASHLPSNLQFLLMTPQSSIITPKKLEHQQLNSTRNGYLTSKKHTTVSNQDSPRNRTPSLARKRYSIGLPPSQKPAYNYKNIMGSKIQQNNKRSIVSSQEESKNQNLNGRQSVGQQSQGSASQINGSVMSTPAPQ